MLNLEKKTYIVITDEMLEGLPSVKEACEKLYRQRYTEIAIIYCQVNDLDYRLLFPQDDEDYKNSILAGASAFGLTESSFGVLDIPGIKTIHPKDIKQSDYKPQSKPPFYSKFLKKKRRK